MLQFITLTVWLDHSRKTGNITLEMYRTTTTGQWELVMLIWQKEEENILELYRIFSWSRLFWVLLFIESSLGLDVQICYAWTIRLCPSIEHWLHWKLAIIVYTILKCSYTLLLLPKCFGHFRLRISMRFLWITFMWVSNEMKFEIQLIFLLHFSRWKYSLSSWENMTCFFNWYVIDPKDFE